MKHPEQKSDETFVAHVTLPAFNACGLKTKRLGAPVVDGLGDKPLFGEETDGDNIVYPLFVKREEAQR